MLDSWLKTLFRVFLLFVVLQVGCFHLFIIYLNVFLMPEKNDFYIKKQFCNEMLNFVQSFDSKWNVYYEFNNVQSTDKTWKPQ